MTRFIHFCGKRASVFFLTILVCILAVSFLIPAASWAVPDGEEKNPALAYDPVKNRYLSVFESYNSSFNGYIIKGRFVLPDGTPDGSAFDILSAANSNRTNPDVAFDSVNNRFLVVFEVNWGNAIDARLVDADGTPGTVISVSATPATVVGLSVTFDPVNEQYLVVWSGDGDIYGQRIDAAGTKTGSLITIANPAGSVRDWPAAAFSPEDETFLVVWHDQGAGGTEPHEMYGQRVTATGTLAGSNFLILSKSYGGSAVLYDSLRNRFFCAGAYGDTVGRFVNTDGTMPDAEFIISNATGGKQEATAGFDSRHGRFFTVWRDARNSPTHPHEQWGQGLTPDGAVYGSPANVNLPMASDSSAVLQSGDVAYAYGNDSYLLAYQKTPTDGTTPSSIVYKTIERWVDLPRVEPSLALSSPTAEERQEGAAWPDPRFEELPNGTEMEDLLTGLVWRKAAGAVQVPGCTNPPPPGSFSAVHTYVACLNTMQGTDYRIPNINELSSLVNYGNLTPYATPAAWLLGKGFTGVNGSYWSSTSWNGGSTVMTVDFATGRREATSSGAVLDVWLVRGGTTPPAKLARTGQETSYVGTGNDDGALALGAEWLPQRVYRFQQNADGSFTDVLTGLVWLGHPDCAALVNYPNAQYPGKLTLYYAYEFVRQMNGGLNVSACGYTGNDTDWRVPNINEMASLIDMGALSPLLITPPGYATYPPAGAGYWTSTGNRVDTSGNTNWTVGFDEGVIIPQDIGSFWQNGKVWPVRGGYKVAELGIVKESLGAVVRGNANLTYRITVTNHGFAPAIEPTVTDTLPAGSTHVSTVAPKYGCTETTGTVVCNRNLPLDPGESDVIRITIDTPVIGPITNTATVSSLSDDPNTDNNIADVQTSIVAVTAAFSLTVDQTGGSTGGDLSTDDGTIDCAWPCQTETAWFGSGTQLTLTALPAAGHHFFGWRGDPDCVDGNVTMDHDFTCTALFNNSCANNKPFLLVDAVNGDREFDTLQDAIDVATAQPNATEIRIQQGTYSQAVTVTVDRPIVVRGGTDCQHNSVYAGPTVTGGPFVIGSGTGAVIAERLGI